MTVVDEIKDRLDIVELIGEGVRLKKSGKNYTGFCPFHQNTRTPAFVVFPETGTWRCFGACNEGGDVFSYVMKREGWEFKETLRVLAERAGVELTPRSPEQEQAQEEHERLRELLESAVTYFRHQLHGTPAGQPVLEYLRGRGIGDQALETFELGYAPDAWQAIGDHFKDKSYDEGDLLEVGLVSEREEGGSYDRFRNRIMIPIRDHRGRMSGFGARIVNPDDVPKFLNSPQTVLFDKGDLLYGMDKARRAIRSQDQAVIVEGYMDVIALHQAGFENAVSPMGTALTERQLRRLKRYSRKIVLALDADTAGDRATLRGLSLARDAMGREADPVFGARGLIRYEGRLDAELRVISLPEGRDPDEVVEANPDAWPALLSGAQTVVDYVMDTLMEDQDLDDAKVKGDIARHVLPLVEDVADPVERQAYRQNLARRLKVDERALLEWGSSRPAPSRRSASRPPAGDQVERAPLEFSKLERFCLGILLRKPELLYRVDRELQTLELERLRESDFSSSDLRLIFDAVRKAIAQDEREPREAWRAALEEPLLTSAREFEAGVVGVDLDLPRVTTEALAAFLRLRKENLSDSANHMLYQVREQEEAGESGDPEQLENLMLAVQDLAVKKSRLERALARRFRPAEAVTTGRGW